MKPKYSIIIPLGFDSSCEVTKSIKQLDYDKKNYEVLIDVGPNASKNRNKGIKKAKGDILLFLDGHSEFTPDLLHRADFFFEQYPDVHVVGGPQLNSPRDTLFGKANGLVLSTWFASLHMSRRYKLGRLTLDADETYLTSAICFVKRAVFNKERGFDERIYPAEDPELFARLKNKGYILAFSSGLFVYHKRRSNVASFFKQIYTYGLNRGSKEKISKSTKPSLFYLIPLAFVVYLIVLAVLPLIVNFAEPLSFLASTIYYLLYIPLLVYVLVTLLYGIFFTIKEKNIAHVILSPLCFFVVNIAYGVGTFVSFFKTKKTSTTL